MFSQKKPVQNKLSLSALSTCLKTTLVFSLFFSLSSVYAEETINDVTKINPITVDKVITPHTTEEIVAAINSWQGPISIGGGKYSQGGQTAKEASLHIDMREFNKILDYKPAQKEITVQSGIRWRDIQELIDKDNLSIKIMQSYSNFTVGGALSVNAHGRYMGEGPVIFSVKQIKVVLADGSLVIASPQDNQEVFNSAIGGYGGIGVITEVTLELADNVKMERVTKRMLASSYKEYFEKNVKNSPIAIFHNADFYPPNFDSVTVTTWNKTDKPVTVSDRLIPQNKKYPFEQFMTYAISEWPGGKWFRGTILAPILNSGKKVVWRNYEASYDVAELEPKSREDSTYVLQEYFVPVEKFDEFYPKMGKILNDNNVNALNVSIRYAKPDPGSMMAWTRGETFAFVLYYKQGTSKGAIEQVGDWTRKLIDEAIAVNGTYYLPYQIHATNEQFKKAYPNFQTFFSTKQKLDPTNKFQNKLWDAYYQSPQTEAQGDPADAPTQTHPKYKTLPVEQGYFRFPEWYVVYASHEYATFLKNNKPSEFPYVTCALDYWKYYAETKKLVSAHPFNFGMEVMSVFVGVSHTFEFLAKGYYEHTYGRLAELVSSSKTQEEQFIAQTQSEYANFIHTVPWYGFPYMQKLGSFWQETDLFGEGLIRKWERKYAFTQEYLNKAALSVPISMATKALFGADDPEVFMRVTNMPVQPSTPDVRVVEELRQARQIIALPRYEFFHNAIISLAKDGVLFEEIAGNDVIAATVIAGRSEPGNFTNAKKLFEVPLATIPTQKRIAIEIPVWQLSTAITEFEQKGIIVEHVYDY